MSVPWKISKRMNFHSYLIDQLFEKKYSNSTDLVIKLVRYNQVSEVLKGAEQWFSRWGGDKKIEITMIKKVGDK